MRDVKLAEYIEATKQQPFEWGVSDCVLFVCDWCEIVTGVNPAAGAHGKYNSELSAYKYLKAEYGNDPAAYIDKHLQRVEPAFAQKGDICLCDLDGKETFGIVGARGFVFFKSIETGWVARKDVKRNICWGVQ